MEEPLTGVVRRGGRSLAAIALTSLLWLAPASHAADFTYRGNGQSVDQGPQGAWSVAANWAGGVAPSGSVDRLVFPATPGCRGRRTQACLTTDDVSDLSANALEIRADYLVGGVTGDRLTLGAGGLTMDDSPSDDGRAYFAPPITLGAAQTWSIVGNHRGTGLQVASVTGADKPLAIDFSNNCADRFRALCTPRLDMASDVEVGPVTATGPGVIELTGEPYSLNSRDGSPVAIRGGASLVAGGAALTGPLSLSHGFLQLNTGGQGFPSAPMYVTGDGSVSFDSSSGVTLFINGAGRTAGKDFAQLRARGPVSIAGAVLTLSGPDSGPYCARLHRGRVDTLITTTGSLSGMFRAVKPGRPGKHYLIRNGKTIPVDCVGAEPTWNYVHAPRVRINYTPHSVTATVVRARATK